MVKVRYATVIAEETWLKADASALHMAWDEDLGFLMGNGYSRVRGVGRHSPLVSGWWPKYPPLKACGASLTHPSGRLILCC